MKNSNDPTFRISLFAALGGLLFGYDTAVISGAIGFLQTHFSLSAAGVGWVASCALVGCVPGALSAGWLNYSLGRRATLIISATLFLISAIGTAVPEELTTFVIFRKRLRKHGHSATLFHKTLEILKQRGVILEEGTCVDATIIETSRGRKHDDGSNTRDRTASYTKKNDRIYHGFKAHIATDTNGIIKDYRFDTAKVHDSQHIDDLIADEQHCVFADSAYMSGERKKELEDKGVFCGIIHKRVRGQKELTPEQKWHNRLVAGFRAVVEHPFAWMKNTGYRRARYRGLRRNGMDFALHAIAYNLKGVLAYSK